MLSPNEERKIAKVVNQYDLEDLKQQFSEAIAGLPNYKRTRVWEYVNALGAFGARKVDELEAAGNSQCQLADEIEKLNNDLTTAIATISTQTQDAASKDARIAALEAELRDLAHQLAGSSPSREELMFGWKLGPLVTAELERLNARAQWQRALPAPGFEHAGWVAPPSLAVPEPHGTVLTPERAEEIKEQRANVYMARRTAGMTDTEALRGLPVITADNVIIDPSAGLDAAVADAVVAVAGSSPIAPSQILFANPKATLDQLAKTMEDQGYTPEAIKHAARVIPGPTGQRMLGVYYAMRDLRAAALSEKFARAVATDIARNAQICAVCLVRRDQHQEETHSFVKA